MTEAQGIVIAAIIAVGGAALAYLAGRHQVRDQAFVEHAQWLRTQRLQAYTDYLVKFDEVTARARHLCARTDELRWEERWGTPQFDPDEAANDLIQGATDMGEAIPAAQTVVSIFGNEACARGAADLRAALPELRDIVIRYINGGQGVDVANVDTLVTEKRAAYLASVRDDLTAAPQPKKRTQRQA